MSGKGSGGRSTKKKTITLEKKLDILRRFDNGEKAVDIAKALNLAATTVRTIQARDRIKIKEAAKSVTSVDAKTMTRTRSGFMVCNSALILSVCVMLCTFMLTIGQRYDTLRYFCAQMYRN